MFKSGLAFRFQVHFGIDAGRRDVGVAQPAPDRDHVHTRLREVGSVGVANEAYSELGIGFSPRRYLRMAANVVDDEEVEDDRHKATLRMIAKVGLQPLEGAPGEYEIFALNSRSRSMPPTEINGASRRILALSFVLGLCKVSRTLAPLVADSLLNFMSGSVRTNTLRITAETASQPIPGCLREGAKSYAKPVPARRRGPSTPVQEARTFWPCGPTYL